MKIKSNIIYKISILFMLIIVVIRMFFFEYVKEYKELFYNILLFSIIMYLINLAYQLYIYFGKKKDRIF